MLVCLYLYYNYMISQYATYKVCRHSMLLIHNSYPGFPRKHINRFTQLWNQQWTIPECMFIIGDWLTVTSSPNCRQLVVDVQWWWHWAPYIIRSRGENHGESWSSVYMTNWAVIHRFYPGKAWAILVSYFIFTHHSQLHKVQYSTVTSELLLSKETIRMVQILEQSLETEWNRNLSEMQQLLREQFWPKSCIALAAKNWQHAIKGNI